MVLPRRHFLLFLHAPLPARISLRLNRHVLGDRPISASNRLVHGPVLHHPDLDLAGELPLLRISAPKALKSFDARNGGLPRRRFKAPGTRAVTVSYVARVRSQREELHEFRFSANLEAAEISLT